MLKKIIQTVKTSKLQNFTATQLFLMLFYLFLVAITYTNIGTLHLDRKNFAKAIQNFEKAVKIQEQ